MIYLVPPVLLVILLAGLRYGFLKDNDAGQTCWYCHHGWLVLFACVPMPLYILWAAVWYYVWFDDFVQHFYLKHNKGPMKWLLDRYPFTLIITGGILAGFLAGETYPALILLIYVLIGVVEFCQVSYMNKHNESPLHRLGGYMGLYRFKYDLAERLSSSPHKILQRIGAWLLTA